ncbi:helix-turn-helix transcriptional regulator [Streptomyces sp. NPDC004658]|uniref:helix-turn-helix domain-containing protein n=1 Tax=Streptomyces sp. NPDC004658 TaxID=3154672 RepID=UPI0033BE86CF
MTQPQPDWSVRLALSVAREVRRHRQAQGLSAQQLSDRCSELGMPIQRSVLANLESGRRTTVTIAEVLVLAAALNVPPALLVFPVGRAEEVEMLPGFQAETLEAVDWFAGIKPRDARTPFSHNALFLYRRHRVLTRELRRQLQQREDDRAEYLASDREGLSERLERARERAAVARDLAIDARERFKRASPEEQEAAQARMARAAQAADVALRDMQELEIRHMNVRYLEQNLASLDDLIHKRAIEVEKIRLEMKNKGLVLPRLRDDLYGIIREIPDDLSLSDDDLYPDDE